MRHQRRLSLKKNNNEYTIKLGVAGRGVHVAGTVTECPPAGGLR